MIRKFTKNIKKKIQKKRESDKIIHKITKDLKWICFCDSPGPTYQISFKTPLEHIGYTENKQFIAVSEKEISTLKENRSLEKFLKKTTHIQVAIFTRYGATTAHELLKFYQRNNIKTINHLDDYLLEVPKCLGDEIYNRLNQAEKITARKFLLTNADLNYISTRFLKEKLSRQFEDANFFSGIYASYSPFKEIIKNNSKFKIGYMGSKGHIRDFTPIIPELNTLLSKRSDIIFEFFGTIKPPQELLKKYPNQIIYHPPEKNYQAFLNKLNSLNWDLGIIPLINDEWNNCKAPTKFIEYTMCNIPVVSSDTIVYKEAVEDSNAIIFVKENQWSDKIINLLNTPNILEETLVNAKSLCKIKFNKEILSEQVNKVLHEL